MSTGSARFAFCLLIGLLCSSLSGCGSVRLIVPEGAEIRLLQEEEVATIRTERRIWFWLWGAKKISDDSTLPEIEEHGLKEIRIDSKQTPLDMVLSAVCGIASFVCRTVVVEGNA